MDIVCRDLFMCCRKGDVDGVRRHLAGGLFHAYALHEAVRYKQFDILCVLLAHPLCTDKDLDINFGAEALIKVICHYDDVKSLKIVLDSGRKFDMHPVHYIKSRKIFYYLLQTNLIDSHFMGDCVILSEVCRFGDEKMMRAILADPRISKSTETFHRVLGNVFYNHLHPKTAIIFMCDSRVTSPPKISVPEFLSVRCRKIYNEFTTDFKAAKLRWTIKLREPQQLFCTIVCLSGGHLQLTQSHTKSFHRRFFAIVTKLPMEMQWKIANAVCGVNVSGFSTGRLDENFRDILANI